MLLIYLIVCFAFAMGGQQKPVLQEITLPRRLEENQTIRLNCDLLKGSKPIKFGWFFEDEPVRHDDRLQITYRDDMSSLMIKDLSIEHIGTYKCVARNDQGSDQQTVAVLANSK